MGTESVSKTNQTTENSSSSEKHFLAVPTTLFSLTDLKPHHVSPSFTEGVIRYDGLLDVQTHVFLFKSRTEWVTATGILTGSLLARDITAEVSEGSWKEAEKLEKLFPNSTFLSMEPSIPLLFATSCEASVMSRDVETVEEYADYRVVAALKTYAPLADKLAKLIGRNVILRNDKNLMQPPEKFEKTCIHLFMHHRPPGMTTNDKNVRKIFGHHVYEDQSSWLVHTAAQGRGRIIEAEGQNVIQVIGNNFYFLLPMLSSFNGISSVVIFKNLLEAIHMYLADGNTEPVGETLTPELFSSYIERQSIEAQEEYKKLFDDSQLKIKLYQKELNKELRSAMQYRAKLKGLVECIEVRSAIASSEEDFSRLLTHAHVRALLEVDDGLHIMTTDVVLDHEGQNYNLGEFVIRISGKGEVDVWSENPRHPKEHHHPHIDKKSLACFGNVALAISKYASQYRFIEAAELVLRWLWNYSPATTLIPLEEWPSEPVIKESVINRIKTVSD